MLTLIKGLASKRKQRLFACACCRRIWQLIPDPRSRAAVVASEAFADKLIDREALAGAQREAMLGQKRFDEYVYPAANAAASTARISVQPLWIAVLGTWAVGKESARVIATTPKRLAKRENVQEIEAAAQAEILRCLVGPVAFRLMTFSPVWLTPTAVGLAHAIYEDCAFDRLPILADALQDAGCEDADILAHCRGDGPHARGCWVVDGVLGKG
ncbi:hypothetical protein [Limnoglobus roseus]|nr:hypothetical protein [Limnoglobus roseus]